MDKDFLEGRPDTVGWHECQVAFRGDCYEVYWWNGQKWFKDKRCVFPFEGKILRFRGPLILAPEPSQGARERAKIKLPWSSNPSRGWCFTLDEAELRNRIEQAITDAEQDAFQRGKEEGRREAAQIAEQLAWSNRNTGNLGPEQNCIKVRDAILATDPPAATEPEKRPPLTKEIATAIWANLEPGSRIQEGMAILTDYILDLQQRVKRLEEKE